ncbi:MAG: alkaline phosphatase D family protein, partial [Verrucomicrobiota bacterium]
MSTLREPSLGPIIGHTTDRSCRIWIRGSDAGDSKSDLSESARTIGVLTVSHIDGKKVDMDKRHVFYFRLHREFDRTGTFVLGEHHGFRATKAPSNPRERRLKLQPDTEYTIQTGSLSVDDNTENDANMQSSNLTECLPAAHAWLKELDRLDPGRSQATFRTFPDSSTVSDELRFLLGSCRYPGLAWKRKHSDRIFGPIYKEFQGPANKKKPRFTLMVGDQIYADMFNRFIPLGLADTYEEFQERYHSAFGSSNMRRLLSNATTYMILDDHEIEDNWSQDRMDGDDRGSKRRLFNIAIGAYASYQWSHCSRTFGRRFYYDFECGGYPFFVLDSRTQRFRDEEDIEDNHLLGRPSFAGDEPSQLESLCKWLATMQKKRGNSPKFIVTSGVFVPNDVNGPRSANKSEEKGEKARFKSDSWPAFPTTREQLLDTIVSKNIQNVIFLSGDVHCANVAEINFSGTSEAEALRSYSITSSAFYWPFPFADGDPANFVHDSTDDDTPDTFKVNSKVNMDYKAWNFTQEDNY